MKRFDVRRLSVTAMLTAIAFLCVFVFRFKVAFLTFDLKDAVITIISLLYGPVWSVMSAGIVAFLEMITMSETGPYGMIMNFLSSGSFAFTAGIIYKYNRTFKGAIAAVIAAAFSVTSVMMLANIFITPHYLGANSSEVIMLIPSLLLPFNASKAIVNSAVVLVIYKPITNGLKRIGLIRSEATNKGNYKRTFILYLSAIIVLILTISFIILILNGSFELFRS